MTPKWIGLLLIIFVLTAPAAVRAQEEEAGGIQLDEIVVEDTPLMPPGEAVVDPETPEAGVPADTGELLRNTVPGVTGVRMGGHGMDPVIRGQMGSRLNIILEDAFIQGGCPNRMDPSISYAPYESYDRIIVLKGPRSIRYPGGSGGMILLERYTPPMEAGDPIRGDLTLGYADNGDRFNGAVDVATGIGPFYVRAIYNHTDAENYVDGGYEEVPSAFLLNHSAFMAGWVFNDKLRADVTYEMTRVDNALFPGSGMDAPKTEGDIFSARVEGQDPGAAISGLRIHYYQSFAEHTMDNYSLRERTAPMPMFVDTTSRTVGGRAEIEFTGGPIQVAIGSDGQSNRRDADRMVGPDDDNVDVLQSYLIPDATLDQIGAFIDMEADLGDVVTLGIGVRYDQITTSAEDADEDPTGMPMTANQLYDLYYGEEAEDRTEENIGAIVRVEVQPSDKGMAFVNLSRVIRTADITERYVAGNNMNPTLRWIGNPAIEPETHHQVEVGVLAGDTHQYLSVALFYDWADDYILRDTARGQDGIGRDDLAAIYRNVNAEFWGGEIDTQWHWTENLTSRVAVAYVQADNRTEQRAIAQIPPLTGMVWLNYEREKWMVGGRLRMTAEQDRIDNDVTKGSGLDAGETPGYGIIDVYSQVSLTDDLNLQMGIFNLLNKEYADHLNKPNAFDPTEFQVNEPGQTVWVRLRAYF